MKRTAMVVMVAVVGVMLTTSCFAVNRSWQIDQGHTGFYFTVDHIFSKVRGHFGEFTGKVNFDPANLEESSMQFVIQTKSIDTNLPKRDKHLQSEDFFDAANYPEMTFTSESITLVEGSTYAVKGTFTVKGKSYDLTLPLVFTGVRDHPMQKDSEVAGFNGSLILDRLVYKVGDGKFFDYGVVGKDVDVLITLEMLHKK